MVYRTGLHYTEMCFLYIPILYPNGGGGLNTGTPLSIMQSSIKHSLLRYLWKLLLWNVYEKHKNIPSHYVFMCHSVIALLFCIRLQIYLVQVCLKNWHVSLIYMGSCLPGHSGNCIFLYFCRHTVPYGMSSYQGSLRMRRSTATEQRRRRNGTESQRCACSQRADSNCSSFCTNR